MNKAKNCYTKLINHKNQMKCNALHQNKKNKKNIKKISNNKFLISIRLCKIIEKNNSNNSYSFQAIILTLKMKMKF